MYIHCRCVYTYTHTKQKWSLSLTLRHHIHIDTYYVFTFIRHLNSDKPHIKGLIVPSGQTMY